ncbi:hypothetical protein AMJ47_00725 [Parcubacteria bacterium DG_72]|nr:MAG: hypothetical protein AMJ47_00725 [Parcubacteria bacterium DG_72]
MLKENLQKDLKQAVKERKEIISLTLRLLLAAVSNKEKEKKYKTGEEELAEQELLEVVVAEVKKRKEAIREYEKGKRQDLAEKEEKELEVLAKYLPEQLSEKELKDMVQQAIQETGAEDLKDMGKVMSQTMPKVKGRADGSQVSQIVRDLLEKNAD